MNAISLVCIGGLKTRELLSLNQEYIKRLKPFVKFSLIELPAAKQGASAAKEHVIEKECQRLAQHLESYRGATVVLLDERGKEYTSQKFCDWLMNQFTPTVFVLGGAFGFNDEFRKKYSTHLALSQFTLQHDMARVLFLEQLYRATTIAMKKTYHY